MNIRMFSRGVSLLAVIASIPAFAHAQNLAWINQFGTPAYDAVGDTTVGESGVYMVGSTLGSLPGFTNAGSFDGFVRKVDFNGVEMWTRQIGTPGGDQLSGIAGDDSGIYVVGTLDGTLPGQANSGGTDIFIQKYDADGNEIWTRQFGTSSFDYGYKVSVDASGVYVIGITSGDFPGYSGNTNVDSFIRKYDFDGNEIWTRQFGTDGSLYFLNFTVSPSGIYVGGYSTGSLHEQPNMGSLDAVVYKLDATGSEVWSLQFGTAGVDAIYGMSVDGSSLYIAGSVSGELPGQSSGGSDDCYVRKYDLDGQEVWTRQFGGLFRDSINDVLITESGVLVGGDVHDPLPGQVSAGQSDAFVREYDADGNEIWTKQFGSTKHDRSLSIELTPEGLMIFGETTGDMPDNTNMSTARDVFIAGMSSLTPAGATDALIFEVVILNLNTGIENSLDAKLDTVLNALEDINTNNDQAAINALEAFINAVQAQSGKKIAVEDADALIASAQAIIDSLSGS